MILEVCANSYESAMNAEKGGADRIELCSELALGGITPSYGLIKKVMENISIPVHVLIRPRSGDFTYNDPTFEIMKEDILMCKKLNCSGVVSGILKKDQTIDIARTKELISITKPLSFTFHRAFDWVPNSLEALQQLITLGANNVLSSGQSENALAGLDILKMLLKEAGTKIDIIPGGGINLENIMNFKNNGFNAIHCSAISSIETMKKPTIPMTNLTSFDDSKRVFSDVNKIKVLRKLVK